MTEGDDEGKNENENDGRSDDVMFEDIIEVGRSYENGELLFP